MKVTKIGKVTGDIDEFKEELSKIVSNADIRERVGSLEVKGIHTQKIKKWLIGLGF